MSSFAKYLKTFCGDESGAATGWNLAWFAIIGAGAGFAIDVSNARQAKEHLNVAAEAAAHAGLIELAAGADEDTVRATVLANIETNVNKGTIGTVVANETTDIQVTRWDPETSTFSSGTPNAVTVLLRRDDSTDNSVKTFLLDMIGFDQWNIRSSSGTAFVESQRCSNNEGIFAHGYIQIRSSNVFGPGFCMHSMDRMQLSLHNVFQPGSFLSMPDEADCGKCEDDLANPGVSDASYESNYQLDDVGTSIQAAHDSFMGTTSGGMADSFWQNRSLAFDKSALSALGIDTTVLAKGDVVSMTADEFISMSEVPGGLTYNVACDAANGNGGMNGNSKKTTALDFNNAILRDVAIITNCAFNFGNASDVLGSVLISSSGKGIYESAGAQVGSASGSCAWMDRVWVMADGDTHMAAGFIANNVSFMLDGDVHLASGTSGTSTHKGVAIHSSGIVDSTTSHNFFSCGFDSDTHGPSVMAIRNIYSD